MQFLWVNIEKYKLQKEWNMKNRTLLKIAVLSTSFFTLAPNAVSVAMADIARAFPQADAGTIALILTLPSLTVIPFSMLSGFLAGFMKKRLLAISGLLLMLLGGMGPLAVNDLGYILALRAVLGIGLGIVTPLTMSLITAFFESDERNTLIGFQSVTLNLGLIILSFFAGLLTLHGWQSVFWVYASVIPILLLILFKLPEPERLDGSREEKNALNKTVALICFLTFLQGIFVYPLFTQLALLVVNQGMGNAASVGLVMTASTIAALTIGLVFSRLLDGFKNYTSVLGLGVQGLGFLFLSLSKNLAMVYLGAILVGAGNSVIMTFIVVRTAMAVHKSASAFAIGLAQATLYLGQFLSPILLAYLTKMLENPSERFVYLLCTVAYLSGAVIFSTLHLLKGKYYPSRQ